MVSKMDLNQWPSLVGLKPLIKKEKICLKDRSVGCVHLFKPGILTNLIIHCNKMKYFCAIWNNLRLWNILSCDKMWNKNLTSSEPCYSPITFAKQIFHSVSYFISAGYFTRRRRISLKKHLPKQVLFHGCGGWTWTNDLRVFLTRLRLACPSET